MKHYISVGIGDMMSLDALLTSEERESITEIYWACRWGDVLVPLMKNNSHYPNLVKQYTIPDDIGSRAMSYLEPGSVNFWHFRPDFHPNYEIGLRLFGIEEKSINVIDAVAILNDPNRKFQGSSFLMNVSKDDVDWEKLSVFPDKYILFHYPTSTRRGRHDIARIEADDWKFVEKMSIDKNLDVVIISDISLDVPIGRSIVLNKPPITEVVALCKYAAFYVGCDSFVSLLACKRLSPGKLFVKGHDYRRTHGHDIKTEILSSVWLQNHFSPHSSKDIAMFYKSKLGAP